MYYRRKILLSLMQVFDNRLEKLKLQKLLFLFSQLQANTAYDFVPYRYGCFSFQANADLLTLRKYSIVSENDNVWTKEDDRDYVVELKKRDRQALNLLVSRWGNKSRDELLKLTYEKYPYYAINSTVAEQYLSEQEIADLDNYRSHETRTVLFTIGYEGVSLEQYLNKLLQRGVKTLCDVRKNALSMKYGFSKRQLKNACSGVGIEYIHFPEVGIVSDKRQNLKTQTDYDELFLRYRSETLPATQDIQKKILGVLASKARVALTCFEANIGHCHRKSLAEAILNLAGFNCQVEHI